MLFRSMSYDDYFYKSEMLFETIYEAEYRVSGEFDWWNSVDSLEQLESDDVKCDTFADEWVQKFITEWLEAQGLPPELLE